MSSDTYFYTTMPGSNDIIYKFIPQDNYNTEKVNLGDALTIKDILVSCDNNLTIHGFRTSDRSTVLATVDSDDNYSVIENSLPDNIKVEVIT